METTHTIYGETDGCLEEHGEAEDQINLLVDILYDEFNDDMELFYETKEDALRDVLENIQLLCAVI